MEIISLLVSTLAGFQRKIAKEIKKAIKLKGRGKTFFFLCFWLTSSSFFVIFSSFVPHRGQPAAKCHPSGNLPGDWQSAVGWGDTGFEPRTAGQQSGVLPLSHHASRSSHHISQKGEKFFVCSPHHVLTKAYSTTPFSGRSNLVRQSF